MDEPEPGAKPRFSGRAVAVLGATAVVAVALDQWVKWLSTENLEEGHPVRILGGLIYLSLLRNSGAAFSFGSDHTWVFPVITLVVIGWITWMATRPSHVSIDELVMRPRAQAAQHKVHRVPD